MTYAAAHNSAVALAAEGDHQGAETSFREALALNPAAAETRYSLAKVLLAQGRYAEAWPLYEARRDLARLRIPRVRNLPEWRGEPLAGRRLLVVGEQGLGDQILFARFVPAGARYFCDSLLRRAFAFATPSAEGDCWCLVGSLPFLLSATRVPPMPRQPAVWPPRRIGVMAAGRPETPPLRSPVGADADRLLSFGRDLSPVATGARDFRDTAEIIQGLDLVITVDTAVGHLAGSMGKATWILLPPRNVYWPWGVTGATTSWYESVRLFRREGEWSGVLDRVEAALN